MSDDPSDTSDPSAPSTHFAPAERADAKDLDAWLAFAQENPLIKAVQECVDGYLMILNPQRQILAANERLLNELQIDSPACLAGKRPGEAMSCIHACEGPGGCGTSKACSSCGAVLAILESQRKKRVVESECLMSVRKDHAVGAAEFRVRATPMRIGGHDLTVVVFTDISSEKRRLALERVFFHDIMNTIGGLVGWSHLLKDMEDPRDVAGRIVTLSQRLSREVQDQRRLLLAEEGTLEIAAEKVAVSKVFETLKVIFEVHDVLRGRFIKFAEDGTDGVIETDYSLLVRVLTNMIKNALEASALGDQVTVWVEKRDEGAVFMVNNPAVMPDDVRLRIFQRSFSTKGGSGRGLGTYSMKLFGERYLGGSVDFTSEPDSGTTFRIALPDSPPPRAASRAAKPGKE